MDSLILRQAQALYVSTCWWERLHVAVRLALCPFERLAAFVPPAGLIVDLGCGHGLFANALALESPERRVVGVELSARKLAVAQAVSAARGGVQFVQGNVLANPVAGPCQAILLVDVLYLLTPREQEQVLRTCHERLEPGGVLVLKTMDTRPRYKFLLNWLEEWLAVRLVRITLGGGKAFSFRPLAEWAALCQAIGFETRVVRLERGYYHPHGAMIGIKARQ